MTQNAENCEHEYQEISTEFIEERWQDKEIDDGDLTRSELINRFNGNYRTLVTYQCKICGDQYQDEQI